ncbi:unnamed protein product [Cochlearia groenlandica]
MVASQLVSQFPRSEDSYSIPLVRKLVSRSMLVRELAVFLGLAVFLDPVYQLHRKRNKIRFENEGIQKQKKKQECAEKAEECASSRGVASQPRTNHRMRHSSDYLYCSWSMEGSECG